MADAGENGQKEGDSKISWDSLLDTAPRVMFAAFLGSISAAILLSLFWLPFADTGVRVIAAIEYLIRISATSLIFIFIISKRDQVLSVFGFFIIGALIIPADDLIKFAIFVFDSDRNVSEFSIDPVDVLVGLSRHGQAPSSLELNKGKGDVEDISSGGASGFRQIGGVNLSRLGGVSAVAQSVIHDFVDSVESSEAMLTAEQQFHLASFIDYRVLESQCRSTFRQLQGTNAGLILDELRGTHDEPRDQDDEGGSATERSASIREAARDSLLIRYRNDSRFERDLVVLRLLNVIEYIYEEHTTIELTTYGEAVANQCTPSSLGFYLGREVTGIGSPSIFDFPTVDECNVQRLILGVRANDEVQERILDNPVVVNIGGQDLTVLDTGCQFRWLQFSVEGTGAPIRYAIVANPGSQGGDPVTTLLDSDFSVVSRNDDYDSTVASEWDLDDLVFGIRSSLIVEELEHGEVYYIGIRQWSADEVSEYSVAVDVQIVEIDVAAETEESPTNSPP